jgi:hypothetical protein
MYYTSIIQPGKIQSLHTAFPTRHYFPPQHSPLILPLLSPAIPSIPPSQVTGWVQCRQDASILLHPLNSPPCNSSPSSHPLSCLKAFKISILQALQATSNRKFSRSQTLLSAGLALPCLFQVSSSRPSSKFSQSEYDTCLVSVGCYTYPLLSCTLEFIYLFSLSYSLWISESWKLYENYMIYAVYAVSATI